MKPGDKVRVQLTVDGGYFKAVLEEYLGHEIWRIRIGENHVHVIKENQIRADAD